MPDTGHQAPARARGLTHTRRAQAPWSGRCSAGCCTRGARAGRACCLLLCWRWTLPGRWHTCTRPTAWCAPARGRRPSTRRPAAPAGGARALARRWPPCRARGGPSAGRRSAGASLRMHCSKAPGPHRRGPASRRLAGTACGDRARPPTPGAGEGAGRRRLSVQPRRPRRCTATSRPATCCSRGGAPSVRWARAGCGPRRAPRSMQRPAGSAFPCLPGGSAGRGAEPAHRGCPACSRTPAAWPRVCARGRGAPPPAAALSPAYSCDAAHWPARGGCGGARRAPRSRLAREACCALTRPPRAPARRWPILDALRGPWPRAPSSSRAGAARSRTRRQRCWSAAC